MLFEKCFSVLAKDCYLFIHWFRILNLSLKDGSFLLWKLILYQILLNYYSIEIKFKDWFMSEQSFDCQIWARAFHFSEFFNWFELTLYLKIFNQKQYLSQFSDHFSIGFHLITIFIYFFIEKQLFSYFYCFFIQCFSLFKFLFSFHFLVD